ncbi:hypothetical protein [Tessaracoccus palaemonis]|uniref:Uncharacterized protein n=1 Tax=Tessaracoccus palaemonis TaxID=2829499 RepID=A0ABX8SHY6_9ACTN|nr:hypothetical protein [Tessaracoccus palaemonis]QXT62888.1 hypothetical protein KDB89_14365 [Tessaracoccus palaemonis]
MADMARAESRERFRFEAAQSRYTDRRDAVIAFDQAAEQESERIADFDEDPRNSGLSVTDLVDGYRLDGLMAAHARVAVLTSREVTGAATAVKDAIMGLLCGREGAWLAYGVAIDRYREVSRHLLSGGTGLNASTQSDSSR